MTKLLFIDCCVRGKRESRTFSLCNSFLKELCRSHPSLLVETLSIYEEDLRPMNGERNALRDRLIQEKDWGHPLFRYARQLAGADYVLIGAPYWDLSFPACLKAYLEQTSVTGITFTYVENGSLGLCKAKKLMYLSTAGGFLPPVHAGEEYLRQICDLYGIEGFSSYCLPGLDIDTTDVARAMEKGTAQVRKLAKEWIPQQ